jgi:hypothetical protein
MLLLYSNLDSDREGARASTRSAAMQIIESDRHACLSEINYLNLGPFTAFVPDSGEGASAGGLQHLLMKLMS